MPIWMGLCTVTPNEGNNLLDDAKGAIVNVIGFADTEIDFISVSTEYLNEHDFSVIEIEDIELFVVKKRKDINDKTLLDIARRVQKNKGVEWGTFHTYNEEL